MDSSKPNLHMKKNSPFQLHGGPNGGQRKMVHDKHPLSVIRIGVFIVFLRSMFDALGETYHYNKIGLIF